MRRNLILLALFVLILALPALAQTNGDEKASMNVAEAAVIVAGIVTFIKMKILPALWDKLGDAGKFVLSILTSVGVVVYKYLTEGLAFNVGTIWFLVEVVIAVTSGYIAAKSILPGLSRTNSTETG
jgi:hypothetical protein